MNNKLKQDIIEILEYFDNGLADVESGSGEKQPMHKEIRSALKRLHNLKTLNKALVIKSGCQYCGCESYTKRTGGVLCCQRCNEDWQPVL